MAALTVTAADVDAGTDGEIGQGLAVWRSQRVKRSITIVQP
jgi:hypothetical protein